MSAELQKAIYGAAVADEALATAVDSDIYYGQVPENRDMPWITYVVIDNTQGRTFRAADCFEDALVQFSIFDNSPGISDIETIFDKLDAVFNRANLSYDTRTGIGSIREGRTGPTRLEDCWQLTADYRVHYSST